MHLKEAVDFLEALVKTKQTPAIMNGMLNGVIGDHDEAVDVVNGFGPIMETIKTQPDFKRLFDSLANSVRHRYRYHGSTLEACTAAVFMSAFLAGVQFALSNGKVPDAKANHPELAAPPTNHIN